jgi:hypothetical protein
LPSLDKHRKAKGSRMNLPLAVYIFRSGERYGLTTSRDGSDLPPREAIWVRQAETVVLEDTFPFGIDSDRARADISRIGYHLVSLDEMLRRSMALPSKGR